jgi:zinc finger-like protein
MHHPIQGIRFIHNAIRKGVLEIEESVRELRSAEDAARLAQSVKFLEHEVHMHTSGEEAGIYPRLDERARNVGVHYLFDHDEEENLFRALVEQLTEFSPNRAAEVQRSAASLRYHALLHVKKEEQIVVPLVVKHFSDDEQRSMIQAAVSGYSPEQLMQTFPWIVRAQSIEDRVTFIVDDLMKLMPPEVFGAVKVWIQNGLGETDWSDIVQRAPELA